MATDFFQRQDVARRTTTRLVILFALAVVALIAAIDLLLVGVVGYSARDGRTGLVDWAAAVDPALLTLATFGTLVVVGGGSLYKIAQLRGGGHVVAEELGGRRLDPSTSVPHERRLLNVVEEMALASGTPTPLVFLLDREEGINAFAAGFSPGDAVVAVTRGTAERLTRDELQGVIAHEFSHILNGDMRLNIRLMGVLHGILIVGMIGYYLLRTSAYAGAGRRRSRRENNGAPLLLLGIGLMIVGFFGTFFGNLMKAAVSRQREFLADASAVQFTRQPEGIAGALKKIGGLAQGSRIGHPNAPEASHMFFGQATAGFTALFSTHPPLAERIRRLDPRWNGRFPELPPVATAAQDMRADLVAPLTEPTPSASEPLHEIRASDLLAQIGQLTPQHVAAARQLIALIPERLVQAGHDPYGARALVYALLLNGEREVRQGQLATLSESAEPGVYEETLKLMASVERLDRRLRLPLIELVLPALRMLTPSQYGAFRHNLPVLAQADDTVDLFEWALQRIVRHDLDRHFAGQDSARVPDGVLPRPESNRTRLDYRSLSQLQPQLEVLLSSLAYAGHRDPAAVRAAFDTSRKPLADVSLHLRPIEGCRLEDLDAAVDAIGRATPPLKRRIVQAAVACIGADGRVTPLEAELVRALAGSLDCPIPLVTG